MARSSKSRTSSTNSDQSLTQSSTGSNGIMGKY